MALTFSYELSASGAPEAVCGGLQGVLDERLRHPTGGSDIYRQMRLSAHTATSLSYRPRLVVPLPIALVNWAGRRSSGENVEVLCAPGEAGRTRVSASGKVARGADVAATREFWESVVADAAKRV